MAMAMVAVYSFSVLLARFGGLRDIEFLVQCLQRVYGGSETWLRSGGTLFSLQKLHDKGRISGKDYHELSQGYLFLRTIEHRLQLRRGQQVIAAIRCRARYSYVLLTIAPTFWSQRVMKLRSRDSTMPNSLATLR